MGVSTACGVLRSAAFDDDCTCRPHSYTQCALVAVSRVHGAAWTVGVHWVWAGRLLHNLEGRFELLRVERAAVVEVEAVKERIDLLARDVAGQVEASDGHSELPTQFVCVCVCVIEDTAR